MKKSTMILTFGMLSFVCFGQKTKEANVPQVVKNAFYTKIPNAKEVKWDKEGKNYEASFDINKVDNSILFNQEGKIVETETEIQINELPKNVLDYVKKHYPGQTVKEAAKITDTNNKVAFEAEIKGMDLIFDGDGNFVKEAKD